MPNDKDFEGLHRRNLRRKEREIRRLYESAIHQITPVFNTITVKGQIFQLKDYPVLSTRINKVVDQLHAKLYSATLNGIQESWDWSNQKNNLLVDKRLAGKKPSQQAKQILYDPNKEALNLFITRKEKGLNLSDRVWKSLDGYKTEMEAAIGLGVSEGRSASEMASDLKKYLNEPDKLFRRVRDAEGKLQLSKAARDYHPGQGVYRSSYKNAHRLARTETNMAYRSADFERWQTLPFVTGIEIRLSDAHIFKTKGKCEICECLKGKYPKDFKFTGWHPSCMCYQVAIQISDEDYDKFEDAILAGTEKDFQVKGTINEPPAHFKKYLENNQERIAGWKNKPYWLKDNAKHLNDSKESPIRTVIRNAKQSATEVDATGKDIAKKYGGTVTPINFKEENSIRRKVDKELGGDIGLLKDSVRNTVIVPYNDLEKVVGDLKKDTRFLRIKVQDGPEYFGYKGVITNFKTKNGLIAEMQVNSPGMIYAKEPKEVALRVIDKKTYDDIAKKTGLPGGLGHKYFEEIRDINPKTASPEQRLKLDRLIEQSKKYYNNFYGF